jgi:hypothetical protein
VLNFTTDTHNIDSKSHNYSIQPWIYFVSIFTFLGVISSTASAYSNSYNNSSSGTYTQSNASNINQPKVRWYRYYGPNGEPNLSSTITEQHLRYGYEALDRNMQVIKRADSYTPDQYAKQKAQRDAIYAQRQADLELRKNYGSAVHAANKRDKMLMDMTKRKAYLETQLAGLKISLNNDITQAASFERQKKPIPPFLKKSLEENQKNVEDAQRSIQSIEARQQQISAEYDQIIRRLNQFK